MIALSIKMERSFTSFCVLMKTSRILGGLMMKSRSFYFCIECQCHLGENPECIGVTIDDVDPCIIVDYSEMN